MRVPDWLNPWWHLDYVLQASMRPEQARAILAQSEGRMHGRSEPDGGLALYRRGGFLNDLVRTRATLARSGAVTLVRVRSEYGPVKSMLMGAAAVVLTLVPIFNFIVVAITRGFSAARGWLLVIPVSLLIWVVVVGANYASAVSEAKDLRRMVEAKLSRPPIGS